MTEIWKFQLFKNSILILFEEWGMKHNSSLREIDLLLYEVVAKELHTKFLKGLVMVLHYRHHYQTTRILRQNTRI